MNRGLLRSVAIAPAAMIAVFVVWPVGTIVVQTMDASSLTDVFTNTGLRRVAWFTLWQAVLSTAVTVAVAMPVTWVISRRLVGWWRPLRGLVTAPFLMPTVVMAVALRAALPGSARSGIVPILLAHVLFNIAVVVRTVGPRWAALPEERLDAARVLGAGPRTVFGTVVLPHLKSSIVQASIVVFVFCFTSFGVVSILGGPGRRTIEVEIFRRAVQMGDVSAALALSLVQMAAILAVLGATRPMTAGRDSAPGGETRPGRSGSAAVREAGGWPAAIAGVAVAAVLIPCAGLALRSVRGAQGWSWRGWTALVDGSLAVFGVDVPRALLNSVLLACAAVVLALPLATAAAAATVHLRHGKVLGQLTLLPLVVSSVTLGFGMVLAFDTAPVHWRDDVWLLAVVHALVALPLAVRVLVPAFAAVDDRQRQAARVLGAGHLRTFVDVDIRQSRGALLSAAGLAAAVSLGEFGATSLLARRDGATLPLVIARLAGRVGDLPQQSAYALAVVMAVAVVGVSASA